MGDPEDKGGDAAPQGVEGALDALLGLLPLDSLPRTGWVLRGVEGPESIAGHALGVAHVALAMAGRVTRDEGGPLALGRVLAMALVHDAPEALSGDLPRPATRHLPDGAKAAMERALAEEVVAPLSADAARAHAEYEAQATPEARFVKGCDRIQLGVRLLGYERAGRRGLDEFWGTLAGEFGEFACLEALRAAILGRR